MKGRWREDERADARKRGWRQRAGEVRLVEGRVSDERARPSQHQASRIRFDSLVSVHCQSEQRMPLVSPSLHETHYKPQEVICF
jgi:hypothetical protein